MCKILEAPQRLFYDNRMDFYQRNLFIREHYLLADQMLPVEIQQNLYQLKPVVLAQWTSKSGLAFELRLSLDFLMEKEGCITLSLHGQDLGQIITTSFSFSSVSRDFDIDALTLKVGCVQSTNFDTLDTLRQATKELHGIQPRVFIVDTLKILGNVLGFNQIEGISNSHHVYSSRRYRRQLHLNYDELWAFLGFEKGLSGNHFASTELEFKPLSSYPSNKRSEQRKRQALLMDIESQLCVRLNRAQRGKPTHLLGRDGEFGALALA